VNETRGFLAINEFRFKTFKPFHRCAPFKVFKSFKSTPHSSTS